MTDVHEVFMSVRDYECDLQGVVNNAVYQNYLEHSRHEFLKAHNIDFAELTRKGINLVVVRAELDYKLSLTSGDQFRVVTTMLQISKLKFGFSQSIIRETDGKCAIQALITGVAINEKGKPFVPKMLESVLL